jgi:hypothetical protein
VGRDWGWWEADTSSEVGGADGSINNGESEEVGFIAAVRDIKESRIEEVVSVGGEASALGENESFEACDSLSGR